ncbi:hypothetical protein CHS0354_006030 [Potamilus streckersoni]|uniref:Uncharacterized protein n=1 Tax=Potamilus streckersoni TaxID=2493646 RepID=A0AAE0S3M1_9BIVA|nr:hypothetical protein CHS0354_006030 [Potamilus streckersoni]
MEGVVLQGVIWASKESLADSLLRGLESLLLGILALDYPPCYSYHGRNTIVADRLSANQGNPHRMVSVLVFEAYQTLIEWDLIRSLLSGTSSDPYRVGPYQSLIE